jgi:glycosyltransferase involved in cell wall biosynthesis
MRVAIDAHMIGSRETGNESYTLNLLCGLAALPEDGDVYQVLTPDPERLAKRFTAPPWFEVHRVWPRASMLRIPVGMPLALRATQSSLLHVSYIAPPVPLRPTVVTVHDLSYLEHPEWVSGRVRWLLTTLVPPSLRRASRVIAISDFTRRELIRRYQVPEWKIAVVPEAAAAGYAVMPDARSRPLPAGVREPFVLAVGNLEPRKNLQRLIEAFGAVVTDGFQGSLVIAGQSKYQGEAAGAAAARLGLGERVVFTGYVEDASLALLYNRAALFIYPSLYEGFGLPPLEAMACGCPVVASNATAIPETVGDAAILVDPLSVSEMAKAMVRVLGDKDLAGSLSAAGRAHAARFSWRRTAELTRAVYRQALR